MNKPAAKGIDSGAAAHPAEDVASQGRGSEELHVNYQPHIDGLRSIAVLAVVIYHLVEWVCPAGFLGVDVFFVISGYLICGGIIRDLRAGTFSMTSFYFRRIRRILPAYGVLIVSVLGAGVVLYHWAALLQLAQTALFSTLFSANLYFWLVTGYFQPQAHANPLLHLWSLGVEEHFYIVMPLALLAVWKLGRKYLVPALGLAFVVSLVGCVLLGERGQSTTAFYLLPTRGWELLAGALLACWVQPKSFGWGAWLAGLGMAMVLMSFWCLDGSGNFGGVGTAVQVSLPWLGNLGHYPFPGLINLPLVLGSALLIRYGDGGWVGRWLRSSPMVGVGKISYSLYLWHWPLIVFAGYVTYGRDDVLTKSSILIFSFLAAYASWRWVEMPVRLNRRFTPRVAFVTAGASGAFLFVFTGVLIGSEGLRSFVHQRANIHAPAPYPFLANLDKFRPGRPDFRPLSGAAIDPAYMTMLGTTSSAPTFCLIGDSHANALAPGLDLVAKESNQSGVYITLRMHPFVEENEASNQQRVLAWIANHPTIRDVYLVGRWLGQFRLYDGVPKLGESGHIDVLRIDATQQERIAAAHRRTARWFTEHGKRVFVFTTLPEYDYTPTEVMARSKIIPFSRSIEITREDYLNRQQPMTEIFQQLQSEGLVTVIPLGEVFFKEGRSIIMREDGVPYYRDGHHLTLEGAYHAAQVIGPLLWPKAVKAGADRSL